MRKITTLIFCLSLIISMVEAYDNEVVHQLINEKAANQSSSLLSELSTLGFSNGIDTIVHGKKIYRWFHEGARLEDETVCRSRNHFHDPLKSWDSAGLNNAAVNSACLILGFENFSVDSSVIWAQKESVNPWYNNLWSWPKARRPYYRALTSGDRKVKEQFFAEALRSLGQVMHLLADSSVPAHVRNDIHVFPLTVPGVGIEVGSQTYESWAKQNHGRLSFTGFVVDNSSFNLSVPNASAPVAISALWDQNKYDGSGIAQTIGTNIGLAEYANANFFSEDTIFKDYPHPAYSDTNYLTAYTQPEVIDAEDGKFDNRMYIKKTVGDVDARLASFSYISYDLIKKGYYNFSPFVLDDKVYNDYAALLIPRAVGYSAGLLNYFFRGNIEIILPQSAIYAFTGSRDTGFTRITLNAKNTTGNNEEMTDGSIELVARYRTVQEDPFQPFDLQASKDYVYVVVPEATGRRTIPRNSSAELVFDRGAAAIIPINAVDISLQIVYHGRLGNEDGAVAVGLKGISDPTPVELMNNMDKVCLNGAWYTAGSPEAIAQVDSNGNGIPEWDIYPHNLKDAYVKISTISNPIAASATQYTYSVGNIGPGYISRAFILADAEGSLKHSHAITVEKTTAADTFTHASNAFNGIWTGQSLKSTVEYSESGDICSAYGFTAPCAIRHAPPFYQFRGTYMWGATGAIFDNPEYPVGQKCSWSLLQ